MGRHLQMWARWPDWASTCRATMARCVSIRACRVPTSSNPPGGSAIGRDLFLDVNTFETGRSVKTFNLVYDYDIGAAITFKAVRLSYSSVFSQAV